MPFTDFFQHACICVCSYMYTILFTASKENSRQMYMYKAGVGDPGHSCYSVLVLLRKLDLICDSQH